jgi:hypothetical protein
VERRLLKASLGPDWFGSKRPDLGREHLARGGQQAALQRGATWRERAALARESEFEESKH